MNFVYFVFVLGITVFIHELGHFIFAKKAGIYVYEFSLGMGPQIFKFNRKNDETIYSIRLFPIGGFVQMAGEEIEEDDKIPVEKRMQSKTWLQRFLTIIAGVMFNFLLAIIILIIVAFISGVPSNKVIISGDNKEYIENDIGLRNGDIVVEINEKKVNNQDLFLLEFQIGYGKDITLKVKRDNNYETIVLTPKEEKIDDETQYKYGFYLDNSISRNIGDIFLYGFTKTWSLIVQMFYTVYYLIIGRLSLNSLSGPIGIFNVVAASAEAGFINIIYLIAFLCVNVGFINLLPIPAFDGGRLLFMVIEKITGKPVKHKTENIIHTIGLGFLMILMLLITWNDIMRFIL